MALFREMSSASTKFRFMSRGRFLSVRDDEDDGCSV